MAVTEQVRQRIYSRFRELWGDEDAEAVMGMIPPAGWDDVVRKRDLDESTVLLRSELTVKMAELRSELEQDMAELRSELKQDMAELRSELKQDMAELRSELKDDMRQQTNRFIAWMLASNTTLVSALAIVVTLAD